MSLTLAHCCRVGCLALWLPPAVLADSMAATQSVSVVLSPVGKVILPASITLLNGALAFSPYTASLPVLFRARTSAAGSGSITVQSSGDFTPSGGPSVAAGKLTYTCAAAAYGAACTGTQIVSPTVQRPVLTLPRSSCIAGGNGCSTVDPASINLLFRLENDVSLPTGTYSVQLTFTISCT